MNPTTLNFWKNEAETKIRLWVLKIKANFDELYHVPDYLLDRNPALNEYRIEIIKNTQGYYRTNISQEDLNIIFDRIFISSSIYGTNHIDSFEKIAKLSLKYDFGAIFSELSCDLTSDKESVFKIFPFFKNPHQLEYCLNNYSLLQQTISSGKDLMLACVQLCPSSINCLVKARYIKNSYDIITLDEDSYFYGCLKIAYIQDPTIAKLADRNMSLLFTHNFLLTIDDNKRTYNKTIIVKVLQINPIAYLFMEWENLFSDEYKECHAHFKELISLSKNFIRESFFEYTNEICRSLLKESFTHNPKIQVELSELQSRRNFRDLNLQKAENITFQYV